MLHPPAGQAKIPGRKARITALRIGVQLIEFNTSQWGKMYKFAAREIRWDWLFKGMGNFVIFQCASRAARDLTLFAPWFNAIP
jgi:hypothetical protein